MDTQRLSARIISRTPLHEGFLKLYRYCFEVQKHAGGVHRINWELMERGNAVGVLAHDPVRDEIVLGNEFRPGAYIGGDYPFRDQLIAGALDPGESPLDAAVREMREECGLVLRDPCLIHPGVYVSSGGTSEKIALVFGTVDTKGADGAIHGSDAQEDVRTVVLPAADFVERLRAGRVDDAKTLIAGHWFAQRRQAQHANR